ncbi:MAG: sigma-54-dependent Fis family transcriptional regulator [Magnetococcales bacterium]|nr:sigma-54-dependent Fis family transcriptional regulator [Magnetococcales bacterium]MBF0156289.1 sigma-54-dependent Fis family transcriptional regulator [Magnetococcales bacterium]
MSEESQPSRCLHVLVVDDEPAIRQVLTTTLKKAGYTAESATGGEEALRRLEDGDVDVAVCDINMPQMNGIELVREVKKRGIETLFLMMTAFASVDTAVQAMKAGAYDYFTKPLRKTELLLRLSQIGNILGLEAQNRALRHIVHEQEKPECLLPSPGMREVERLTRKVAPTDHTVLITGESGTGKGVFARLIHRESHRSGALFIPVNCGSIPENLLESEFFGHTKGAFTGADRAKKGLFQEADKGTLFLDEIGELPLALQVKLLHVLEEKQVRPVGSEHFRKVDVRIVAATNRVLPDMVRAGTFREDLYFRLNVFHIGIPPLRERRQDVPVLLNYLLGRKIALAGDGGRRVVIDPEAEAALIDYPWPGNVREMEHVIERALVLAEGGVITTDDLPAQMLPRPRSPVASGATAADGGGEGKSLRERLRNYEVRVILEAIEAADGDRKLAARSLGIGLSSLYRKLETADLPQIFE